MTILLFLLQIMSDFLYSLLLTLLFSFGSFVPNFFNPLIFSSFYRLQHDLHDFRVLHAIQRCVFVNEVRYRLLIGANEAGSFRTEVGHKFSKISCTSCPKKMCTRKLKRPKKWRKNPMMTKCRPLHLCIFPNLWWVAPSRRALNADSLILYYVVDTLLLHIPWQLQPSWKEFSNDYNTQSPFGPLAPSSWEWTLPH